MEFRVLGPLEVWDGGRRLPLGGFRQRLVLGVLVLRANRPVPTDWLIDAVWGDQPPRTARKTLQAYVSRLRALLGADAIEATNGGYRLGAESDAIDATRFEELADHGRSRIADDPRAAAESLHRALSLWRGLPWGELGDLPAFTPDVQRLRERRLAAIDDRVAADLALGRASALIGELEALIDEYPLHEGFRAHHMLALYRSGRQSDALRAFQSCRRYLGEELGIEPSDELVRLEEQMLLHDPALAGIAEPVDIVDWTMARNPYKGLRSFGTTDSRDFFGRKELVDELVDRVERDPFVTVVGPSGSGKSSAVLAGVIPRLKGGDWTVATMVPGGNPFAELQSAFRRIGSSDSGPKVAGDDLDLVRAASHALPDDRGRLLLVIDQFEELLVHVRSEAIRRRFVRNLVEAVEDPESRLTVLATLRADYFDRALELWPLGVHITSGLTTVIPLHAHEMEAAAARPAELVGLQLEPELVAELAADMADQPGALPLFQYVLTELFDTRTGPVLARSAYRSLGGLEGALARSADILFDTFDEAAQRMAHQILMRLVAVPGTGPAVRRRVLRAELEALDKGSGTAKAVLDAFDEARLLTFDRDAASGAPTVEVAHEALLTRWPRMRDWVEAAREDLRLHTVLLSEVDEWDRSGRHADYLLSGSRLILFEEWRAITPIELTEAETTFLDAGSQQRQRDELDELARRDEELALERRAVRRLRWLVAVVSTAALVSAALVIYATNRSREADLRQREARARELANASIANLDADGDLALLLAIEAVETTHADDGFVVREAEEALHAAVRAHRNVGSLRGDWDLAFHQSGAILFGGDPITLVDPATGRVVMSFDAPHDADDAETVTVSPDGAYLAAGTNRGGWIGVWDAATGERVEVLGPVGDTIADLEYSPDGRRIAALAPGPGVLKIWDTATGDLVVSLTEPRDRVIYGPKVAIAFSSDGTKLAVTGTDDVWILDVGESAWVTELTVPESLTTSVAWIPDSSTVVAGSMDGTIRFWDVPSGVVVAEVNADVGQVVSMALNPSADQLLVGGDTGSVRLWELSDTGMSAGPRLHGMRSMVAQVAFDAAGTVGAAVDTAGRVTMWDVTKAGRSEIATWESSGPVALSIDGTSLATVVGRSVELIDTATWSRRLVIDDVVPYVGTDRLGYGSEWGLVTGLAFNPDGSWLAVTTFGYEAVDGWVTIYDAASGDIVRKVTANSWLRGPAAFNGDGTLVVTPACPRPDAAATVWDTATWDAVFSTPTRACGAGVDLDRDGTRVAVMVASVDDEPNVEVWDIETGRLITSVEHHVTWVGAVEFSPEGDRLLTGGRDGSIRIWDPETGGLIGILEGHTGPVQAAAWSADGSTIVSAEPDGSLRIWDVDGSRTRLELGGIGILPSVALSPDMGWMAVASGRTAEILALDLDDLMALARERPTRNLTSSECATYHFTECPERP